MEEGGGGGRGGEGGGGFDHGSLQNSPSIYRPTPPLTAIDRFLWVHTRLTQQEPQSTVRSKEPLVAANGLYGFSCSTGASGGAPCPSFQETSFADAVFVDGENCLALNWTCEINPNAGSKAEGKGSGKSCSRGMGGKRAKKNSCAALIKGQWTEEEDR